MKKYSVQYAVFAPSDEAAPIREWKTIYVHPMGTVFTALYNILVSNGDLPLGTYLTIYEQIEENNA